MSVEPSVRPMSRYISLKARASFEPVLQVVAGNATALLVEMVSVIAIFFFARAGG